MSYSRQNPPVNIPAHLLPKGVLEAQTHGNRSGPTEPYGHLKPEPNAYAQDSNKNQLAGSLLSSSVPLAASRKGLGYLNQQDPNRQNNSSTRSHQTHPNFVNNTNINNNINKNNNNVNTNNINVNNVNNNYSADPEQFQEYGQNLAKNNNNNPFLNYQEYQSYTEQSPAPHKSPPGRVPPPPSSVPSPYPPLENASSKPLYPHYKEDAEIQRLSLKQRENQYQNMEQKTAVFPPSSHTHSHSHRSQFDLQQQPGSGYRTYQEPSRIPLNPPYPVDNFQNYGNPPNQPNQPGNQQNQVNSSQGQNQGQMYQNNFLYPQAAPLLYQNQYTNNQLSPLARIRARRAPLQQLPPIQTNQILENNTTSNGRRIVSSPLYSSMQQLPRERQDSRTKSLSRASTLSLTHSFQLLTTTAVSGNNNKATSGGNGSGSSGSSGRSFSLTSKSRSFSSLGKLLSLSTKKMSTTSLQNHGHSNSATGLSKMDRSVLQSTINLKTIGSTNGGLMKRPQVYPALLSRVSKVFKDLTVLTINTKDGLEYHDTFTGKMAVDIISRIVRTNDRNLALLLGRSLDAQKFFHDVTYNHRLRDSVHEVYAFSRAFSDMEFYEFNGGASSSALGGGNGLLSNSKHGSFNGEIVAGMGSTPPMELQLQFSSFNASNSNVNLNSINQSAANGTSNAVETETGVNGVFTILTDCYSPTCTRNKLCYLISCPRRLEQQARLNLKPLGGLKRAVSRLLLHETEESKTLWHETVPKLVLDKLDKHEKMRQELIYEFIYTERDYVKDLEFLTDFYIMPLRNPANNIIPEREREAFIRTVFGGVSDLLWLGKQLLDALTRRQQQQKPVIETIADVFLKYVGQFEPFIKYLGNKVFALFEHERQQQVNLKYARFLDAIEKKPELRRQDLLSFLIKGVQRPARYQLLLGGILKNTDKEHPDYKNLVKAKEEIEKVLGKINIQTGESTDRHKIMVLHRLLGKQTLEEKYHFRLNYQHRIIYQVTLSRKREKDNEKIDLYLFEHALLLVKHKFQNKREQHKVFERPIYLPLLYVNSGYEFPTLRQILLNKLDASLLLDTQARQGKIETNYVGGGSGVPRLQLNFLGLGRNQVHLLLFADDMTNQTQVLQQIHQQQKKIIEKNDIFLLLKYETRRFHGNNKINCAVPCYGGKKLLYGTDLGVWVLTVRLILATLNEKICLDPTLVILKLYVTQIEVLVEYLKLLILLDKTLYEYDLACTDLLDHVKNTRLGKEILNHISFFKLGICEERLLVVAAKKGSSGGTHLISIFEPQHLKTHKSKKYEIREFNFSSDPVLISFFKRKLCVGCVKGFEILRLEDGRKEQILDEADPLLDFATQREVVTPLAIHRLGYNFLVLYLEFLFMINKNGWRTSHDWGIFWEGSPQNIAIFYPYLLSFEPGFIEVRELDLTNLLRALVGENIRFLHLNEHEALYACEENGYDIVVSIDFLNLKPKKEEGRVNEIE